MPLPRRPLRPGLLRAFRRVPLPRPPGTARLPPAIAGAREHCPSLSNVLARKWGAHTHADLDARPAPLRGCVLPAPHTTLGHLLCPSSAQLLRPAPSGLTRLPPSFPQVPTLQLPLPKACPSEHELGPRVPPTPGRALLPPDARSMGAHRTCRGSVHFLSHVPATGRGREKMGEGGRAGGSQVRRL